MIVPEMTLTEARKVYDQFLEIDERVRYYQDWSKTNGYKELEGLLYFAAEKVRENCVLYGRAVTDAESRQAENDSVHN